MAINQDVQQKLYDEIHEVNSDLNGTKMTYDIISKMKYLDQVVSEGLRIWPPAIAFNRVCNKDIEYEVDGRKILIEQGNNVRFSIHSIHHDPKYYEEPEKFNPERFNDENKHKIQLGSHFEIYIHKKPSILNRLNKSSSETQALCNLNCIKCINGVPGRCRSTAYR